MRQCAHKIDIEKPQTIGVEKILNKVEQLGLIPQLNGVRVHCLGVHSAGKTPAYWLGLRAFWSGYFKKAGAELITFSMERRINHE